MSGISGSAADRKIRCSSSIGDRCPGNLAYGTSKAAAVYMTKQIAVDFVGVGDLALVAGCLSRCDFFIGNDSGLMHMAAAAGIPTLGLFGPSRAEQATESERRQIAHDEKHRRKLAASGAFKIAYFCGAELFPTSVRTAATGARSAVAFDCSTMPLALSVRDWTASSKVSVRRPSPAE